MDEPIPDFAASVDEAATQARDVWNQDSKEEIVESASGEAEHCRICRGEATIDEPLFFPCKCNGSIRYVHQSCLLQWLAHSQKKHCELCKTPFRFTKLYDSDMPSTVPWPIFLRQASLHMAQYLLKCARSLLVLFVWLGWVPWCMRAVWRGLFWIGDGSWITEKQLQRHSDAVLNSTAVTTAVQSVATRLSRMPQATSVPWGPVSQTLNMSAGEPMLMWFGRQLLQAFIVPYSAFANTTVTIQWVEAPPRSESLLSHLSILQQPTRWRIINDTMVDVLEGQLIAIGILLTFILIFLIREWVVQQQPLINLGVALEDAAAIARAQENRNPVADVPEPIEQVVAQRVPPTTTQTTNPEPVESQRNTLVDVTTATGTDPEPRLGTYHNMPIYQPEDVALVAWMEMDQDREAPNPKRIRRTRSLASLNDSEIKANGIRTPEPFELVPSWKTEDNVPDSWEDVADEAEQKSESNVGGISLITPPESDTEGLNETSANSRPTLRSRPPMPPKEVATHAAMIARSLEERGEKPIELGQMSSGNRRESNQEDYTTAGPSNSDNSETTANSNQLPSSTESRDNTTRLRQEASPPTAKPPISAQLVDWMWGDLPMVATDSDANSEWQTEDGSAIDSDNDDNADHVEDTAIVEQEDPVMAQPEPAPQVAQPAENAAQDPEVLRAAAEAGINPNEVEQIEEGEDMDGVMELIGMQGPIAGLLQNGMFSTVIISMTLVFAVWIPYLLGKIVLIVLAHPIALLLELPLKWASTIADLVIDTFIFLSGCAYYWLHQIIRLTASPFGWFIPIVRTASMDENISKTAYRLTWSAADRLGKNFAMTGGYFSDSDIPIFSIVAHESLENLQGKLSGLISFILNGFKGVVKTPLPFAPVWSQANSFGSRVFGYSTITSLDFNDIVSKLANPNLDLFKISLEAAKRTKPLKLSPWSASERVIAVLLGYCFLASIGFLYLKLRNSIKQIREAERPVDSILVDVLNQAGGVSKVILIISIEMLVFPLYCGFLLDTALLPLFDSATISSRIDFLSNSPWTSIFIHWFAGTCYMFHFALFVAMCRKILRTGVLYFIRDPDDPSFHPVREVLERNVTTQLKKILFSALVYGALVIVCLGAVVWGLAAVMKGVFPIHWSSNEPVLEFPADLLVYNFLMPFAVRVFKPSAGLQDMYGWWFRRCAKLLRLSHFLFNERNLEEEGRLVLNKETALNGSNSKPETVLFIRDGRMVRAPASDQVRIPKGNKTFVEIDPETGNRKDGLPQNKSGLHGKDNKMFSTIYVPPFFRLRIAGFIGLIWAFAAFTGVTLTVIPLLFGRFVFSRLIQSHPRMNDVYAFAIGLYLLGGPVWLFMKYRSKALSMWRNLRTNSSIWRESITAQLPKALDIFLQSLRVVYFYGAFMFLLPSLLGLVWETYILIPLHTYFQRTDITVPPHTIHFVSDWTLGVLFVRVAVHVLLKYPETRVTKALKACVHAQGREPTWLNPDIRVATRAFIIPLTILSTVALLLPLGLAHLVIITILEGIGEDPQTIVYRYSYPLFMASNMAIFMLRQCRQLLARWRLRVRDEVYLVGERLHNFDDKQGKVVK